MGGGAPQVLQWSIDKLALVHRFGAPSGLESCGQPRPYGTQENDRESHTLSRTLSRTHPPFRPQPHTRAAKSTHQE